MIIKNFSENELANVKTFIKNMKDDPLYSTPNMTEDKINEYIKKSNEDQDYLLVVTFVENLLTGVYCWMILKDEKYIESMFIYSNDTISYEEMFQYLKNHYPGYEAFTIFNPLNSICKNSIHQFHADFFKEQKYMRYQGPRNYIISDYIVPFTDQYRADYIKLHTTDGYWDGAKILAARDCFQVFLAIKDDILVGYLDLGCGHEENEIYDLYVAEQYRNKGFGRELMKQAIVTNGTNGLILTVDYDNAPALKIYTLLGFSEIKNNNQITAKCKL